MKIALGTAQFGMRYGVANEVGQVQRADIAAILRRAAQAAINTLDTAIAYGNSEARLGEIGVSGWQIITKLPALPEGVGDIEAWIVGHLSASIQRLRITQLHAVLLHRPADLLGAQGDRYRKVLQKIKDRGIAGAVGMSIYDPAELDCLWPLFRPDLVQAPLNVFDRRLIRSGWLERLQRQDIRVHTRSTFLQGLLLMPAAKRPAYFKQWASTLDRWINWCAERGCSPLRGAISFALAQPGVEKVIVGVDSIAQLDEILLAAAAPAMAAPYDLTSEERDLVEPSRWQLS